VKCENTFGREGTAKKKKKVSPDLAQGKKREGAREGNVETGRRGKRRKEKGYNAHRDV